MSTDVHIRDATAAEMPAVGEIRLAAYRSGGFLAPDSPYAARLRDLGTHEDGDVLVAVLPGSGPPASGPPGSGPPASGLPAPGPLAPGPLASSPPASHDSGGTYGRIIGTVMLQPWPHSGPVASAAGEAEIRALAVIPRAQRGGIGKALLDAVIDRAAGTAVQHLVLSTQPDMRAAHRLYERAGFLRLPDRDWSPAPGVNLLAYGLRLP